MNILTKIFVYLSLASPLLVNRQLFFPFITGKALFFRATVELALVSFVVYLATNTHQIKPLLAKIKKPLFLAVAVFAAIFILTTLTAVNPTQAFWSNFERAEGGWQILHYFLFFALLALVFNSKTEWRNLIRWQTAIGLLVTLYGIAQYFKIWPGFIVHVGSITGTLGNPSYVSIYLVFIIFFAVWLIAEEKKIWLKTLWLAMIPVEIFVIYQSHTRTADLAIGLGSALILILLALQLHQRHREKFSKKFLTLCYLITIFTALIITIASAYIAFNFGDVNNALKSLQPRFWTWSSSLAGFLEKPILGWGAENFPYIFDKYYNANHFGIESWFDRAHNIFLQYLVDGGLALLLAYLSMFFFFYKKLWQLPRHWFWPLLFGLPVIYLTNGLALFEVLPIYLNLFLFFAFFVNYANGFSASSPSPITQKNMDLVGWLVIHSTTFLIAASLYFTIYLPLQKNRLLIQAVKTNNKTVQEVFENFRKALTFYSPVGQAEIGQQLLSFVSDFFEWLKTNNLLGPENKASVNDVIQFAEETYNKDRGRYVGLKNSYLLMVAYLKAYDVTEKKEFLEKARLLAEKEIVLAPTRIEILRQQLKIAELEKDEKTAISIRKIINKLRPDL